MQRRIILLVSCLVSCFSLNLTGCHREQETVKRTLGFDEFRPEYNRYIQNWIHAQKAALQKEEAHLNELIATAGEEQKVLLEGQLASVHKDSEKMDFRLGLGDYLKIGNPSEVPTDLAEQLLGTGPRVSEAPAPLHPMGDTIYERSHASDIGYPEQVALSAAFGAKIRDRGYANPAMALFDDGVAHMAVIEAVERSRQTGRWIDLA